MTDKSRTFRADERPASDGWPLGEITLGSIVGTATGGSPHTTVAGGWAGTDDETSDGPADGDRCALIEDDDRAPERVIDEAYAQFSQREEAEEEKRAEREELDEFEDLLENQ